jgi:type VI protein secretion system component VasK
MLKGLIMKKPNKLSPLREWLVISGVMLLFAATCALIGYYNAQRVQAAEASADRPAIRKEE